jgi:hypothetical protein
MKTMLDIFDRDALVARIAALTGAEKPLWGKMNVSQMVEHCIRWEEMMAGEMKIKHKWLGYLFGKMALNGMIKDDEPLKHGVPTFKELTVLEVDGDFEKQRAKWIRLLSACPRAGVDVYRHPFFGRMTREQTGRIAYKHVDHHLRQFGR